MLSTNISGFDKAAFLEAQRAAYEAHAAANRQSKRPRDDNQDSRSSKRTSAVAPAVFLPTNVRLGIAVPWEKQETKIPTLVATMRSLSSNALNAAWRALQDAKSPLSIASAKAALKSAKDALVARWSNVLGDCYEAIDTKCVQMYTRILELAKHYGPIVYEAMGRAVPGFRCRSYTGVKNMLLELYESEAFGAMWKCFLHVMCGIGSFVRRILSNRYAPTVAIVAIVFSITQLGFPAMIGYAICKGLMFYERYRNQRAFAHARARENIQQLLVDAGATASLGSIVMSVGGISLEAITSMSWPSVVAFVGSTALDVVPFNRIFGTNLPFLL